MTNPHPIQDRFKRIAPHLTDDLKILWAAAEAKTYGIGGVKALALYTGIPEEKIQKGLKTLEATQKKPRVL